MRDIIKNIKEAADKTIRKIDGQYKMCRVPQWKSKCEQMKIKRKMKSNKTAYNTMEYKRVRGLAKKT